MLNTVQEVIRAMTEFGATFPDVNQFLVEADHQQNLPGHLEIDALPRAGRSYEPPDQLIAGKANRKHKNPVGNAENGPNMFAVGEDKKAKKKSEDDEQAGKDEPSQASPASKSSKVDRC